MTQRTKRRAFLTLSALAILGGCVLVAALAANAWAEGSPLEAIGKEVNWVSFTGIVALMGLAVQWGKVQERGDRTNSALKEITDRLVHFVTHDAVSELKQDIDARFDRLEGSIDSLRAEWHLERRSSHRRSHDPD